MKVTPYTDIDAALAAISAHEGPPEAFLLPIADALLDPFGMTMAIITDRILARGWEPDGYEAGSGFRLYRYKSLAP